MMRKRYKKAAAILLAAVVACAPACMADDGGEVKSAEETNPPETNPPETNPPETNPPETNPPETNPPETNPPETNPPETSAPETSAPDTSASDQIVSDPDASSAGESDGISSDKNHSRAIPDNPDEKRLNQTIVDAGELDEGVSIIVNGSKPVAIEPDKSFRDIVDYVTGSAGYTMDYIRPGTRMRETIQIEGDGTIATVFNKVKSMSGASCDIVLYRNGGNSLWMNMKTEGSVDADDAAIVFTTSSEAKSYTVSYDENGGRLSDSISIVRRDGEWYSHFDVTAEKDGETFCGWYDGPGEDARRVFPTDPVTKDTTLYAHYNPYGKVVILLDYGFATEGDSGNLALHLIFPLREDGSYELVALPQVERDSLAIADWLDGSGNPAERTGQTAPDTLTAQWKDASEVKNQKEDASASEAEETETEAPASEETEEETEEE